jgi:hypothetical protein
MYKTKAELVTLIRDNEKLACELLNRIHAAQDSLKAAMDSERAWRRKLPQRGCAAPSAVVRCSR